MATTDMREPTFLVLTVLTDGPRHGYGLIQDVAELSAGRVRLRAGTLYGLLDRLTDDGLVTAQRDEIVDGRLRRYYEISDTGLHELAAQTRRLQSITAHSERRLRLRGVMA